MKARLDKGKYPKGAVITADVMNQIALVPDVFHGEWNYTVMPR